MKDPLFFSTVLVHPAMQVVETQCEARGDPVCRFELRW